MDTAISLTQLGMAIAALVLISRAIASRLGELGLLSRRSRRPSGL